MNSRSKKMLESALKRAKAGTLQSMGLDPWLDARYAHVGGSKRFHAMVEAGFSDEEIAEAFGVKRQTTWYWRRLRTEAAQ
jgi:hypothetical protein